MVAAGLNPGPPLARATTLPGFPPKGTSFGAHPGYKISYFNPAALFRISSADRSPANGSRGCSPVARMKAAGRNPGPPLARATALPGLGCATSGLQDLLQRRRKFANLIHRTLKRQRTIKHRNQQNITAVIALAASMNWLQPLINLSTSTINSATSAHSSAMVDSSTSRKPSYSARLRLRCAASSTRQRASAQPSVWVRH